MRTRHAPHGMITRRLILALMLVLSFGPLRAADRTVEPVLSRIARLPVKSQAVRAAGYSVRLRALEVEFHRGGTYRYLDVPASVYREFLAAESKARYYNNRIKGKYRAIRVREVPLKVRRP